MKKERYIGYLGLNIKLNNFNGEYSNYEIETEIKCLIIEHNTNSVSNTL